MSVDTFMVVLLLRVGPLACNANAFAICCKHAAQSSSTVPAAKSMTVSTFNMFRDEDFFFVGVVAIGSPTGDVGLPIVSNESVWR